MMNTLMSLTEALMLAVLLFSCAYVTVTDLKNGIIQNKVIFSSAIIAVILNAVYFIFFAEEFFIAYCLNVGVMSFISIAFYALHIWAAGDSKLLILTIMLIPTRLYFEGNIVSATVIIIIMIFSFAYIYTVGESVYIGIKEKNLFQVAKFKADIKAMVKQYIKCTCLVMNFDYLFRLLLPEFYSMNTELIMILNMIVVFLSYSIKIFDQWKWLLLLAVPTVILHLVTNGFSADFNFRIYILVAIVLVLRIFSEKYNYQTIPTKSVKKGMVLSYSTVMCFAPSRIKGLPSSTTEDIRTRISEEEADSIRRWEDSKYGQAEITIVRKIPFAIFISFGTIVYVVMRLILL